MRPPGKIPVAGLTVLLTLIHAADAATNDTTAVEPSRPALIVAVEQGDRRAVEKLLRDGAGVEVPGSLSGISNITLRHCTSL